MVIRRQFAFSVRPDFVQHSAEIEKAAHFVVWTAELHLTPREYSLCVFPPDSSALKQISHPGPLPFPKGEASFPIAGAGLDVRGQTRRLFHQYCRGGRGVRLLPVFGEDQGQGQLSFSFSDFTIRCVNWFDGSDRWNRNRIWLPSE